MLNVNSVSSAGNSIPLIFAHLSCVLRDLEGVVALTRIANLENGFLCAGLLPNCAAKGQMFSCGLPCLARFGINAEFSKFFMKGDTKHPIPPLR